MPFQADSLEQDALEVLSNIRSLKNSLAPINRIPPKVLSLIPDYSDEYEPDEPSITLTHVCRSWRAIFISRPSLWTSLTFTDIDKTRTFIERSKSSPLNIYASNVNGETFLDDALSLVIPHIPRLKSLSFNFDAIPETLRNFHCHVPLLEVLEICINSPQAQILDIPLLNGDLPSLRTLSLIGDVIQLPQKKMSSLKEFCLSCTPGRVTVTQSLNFLKSAPLLHTINIGDSIPNSSDSPSERIVTLGHLKALDITTDMAHQICKHLRIPAGVSFSVSAPIRNEAFPPLELLRGTSPNIENLSHITTIDLCFESDGKLAALSGPSGSFRLSCWRENPAISSTTIDNHFFRSISPRILSTTERLTISDHVHPDPTDVEAWPTFQTLLSTNNPHTLALYRCNDKPFIFALDPGKNSFEIVLCPSSKELILSVHPWGLTDGLVSMAKGRASRGARLSSITIIPGAISVWETEVSELREHVTRLDCKVGPSWM